MEDKLEKLLSDFYSEYDPQAYSDELVKSVKSHYGDDYDGMIKDLYAEYDPEAYSVDAANELKDYYGIKKKEKTDEEVRDFMRQEIEGVSQKPYEGNDFVEEPKSTKNLTITTRDLMDEPEDEGMSRDQVNELRLASQYNPTFLEKLGWSLSALEASGLPGGAGAEQVKAGIAGVATAASAVMSLPEMLQQTLDEYIAKPIIRGLAPDDASNEKIEQAMKTYEARMDIASPGLSLSADVSGKVDDRVTKGVEGLRNTMKKYDAGIVESFSQGNVGDGVEQLVNGAIESLPYLAIVAATSGAGSGVMMSSVGATAASARYGEIKDDDRLSEKGKLNSAYLYGGAEAVGELVTFGILRGFKFGNSKLFTKEVADKLSGSILLQMGMEGSSEMVTEASTQSVDYVQGLRDKVDWNQIMDAGAIGAVGLSPVIVGNKIKGREAASKADRLEVMKALDEIVDLNAEKVNSDNPVLKEAVDSEISNRVNRIDEIATKNAETGAKLTKEEYSKLKDINKAVAVYDERIVQKESKGENADLDRQIKAKLESDKQVLIESKQDGKEEGVQEKGQEVAQTEETAETDLEDVAQPEVTQEAAMEQDAVQPSEQVQDRAPRDAEQDMAQPAEQVTDETTQDVEQEAAVPPQIQQDAKGDESIQMREEAQQEQTEEVGDQDMSVVDETKLQEEEVETEAALEIKNKTLNQVSEIESATLTEEVASPSAKKMQTKVTKLQEQVTNLKQEPKRIKDAISKFLKANDKAIKEANISRGDIDALQKANTWQQAAKAVKKMSGKLQQPTVADMRKNLADFIKENESELNNLGKRVVPAMLRKVNNVKSEATLKQATDYIRKVVESKEERAKLKDIDKINELTAPDERTSKSKQTKIKKGKSDTEANIKMQDRLDDIREAVEMPVEEASQRANELMEKAAKQSETGVGEMDPAIARELQNLEFAGLGDMTPAEVKSKLQDLKDIRKEYAEDIAKQREEKSERIAAERQEWVDAIRKKKFKEGKVVSVEEAPRTSAERMSRGGKRRSPFVWGINQNWFSMLDRITKYDPRKTEAMSGPLFDKWARRHRRAQLTHSQGKMDLNNELNDAKKSIFGVKTDKGLSDRMHKNALAPKNPRYYDGKEWKEWDGENIPEDAQVITHGRAKESALDKVKRYADFKERAVAERVQYKEADGSWSKIDLPLNQNIAAKKYMELKDPSLQSTFFKPVETGKDGKQRGMGYTEHTVKAIDAYMDTDVKNYADYLVRDLYPKLYQKYNETYRRINGVNMPFNQFYSNIVREGFETKADEGVESMILGENYFGTLNNGSMIARRGNTLPLRYVDVNEALSSYVTKMELYNAYGEYARDLKRVFKSEAVRREIQNVFGKSQVKEIDGMIEQIMQQHKSYADIYKVLNGIRRRSVIGTLGLKPNQFIKQQASVFALIDRLGVGGTAKAMSFYMRPAQWKKTFDFVMENPIMKERLKQGNITRDLSDVMRTDWAKTDGGKQWTNTFMFFTKWGDIVPIMVGYPELYKSALKDAKAEGLTGQEAKDRAEETATNDILLYQQSALTGDLSNFQAGSPLEKLFTMYMTSQLSYHRQAVSALRGLGMNFRRGDTKSVNKNLRKFLVAHFVLPQAFTLFANGFRFDEDDHKRQLLFGSLLNLPLAGEVLSYALDQMAGKPFDYAPTPVGAVVTYGKKAVSGLNELVKKNKLDQEPETGEVYEVIKDMATFMSVATGKPYSGLMNSTEGIVNSVMGNSRNPVMESFGYSPYALDPQAAMMTRDNRMVKYAIEDGLTAQEFKQQMIDEYGREEVYDVMSSNFHTTKAVKALKEYHLRSKFGYDNDLVNELMRTRSNDDKILLMDKYYRRSPEAFNEQYKALKQPISVPEVVKTYDGVVSESLDEQWRKFRRNKEE